MKALLCKIGLHRWSARERAVTDYPWLNYRVEHMYRERRCLRCGKIATAMLRRNRSE